MKIRLPLPSLQLHLSKELQEFISDGIKAAMQSFKINDVAD